MTRRFAAAATASALVLVLGCSSGSGPADGASCNDPSTPVAPPALTLERVAVAPGHPVDFVPLPGGPTRWLIPDQSGLVRLVEGGALREEPFVDLRDRVTTNPNSGLLAIALHPKFPADPRVFVRYSIDSPLQTVLDQFRTVPGDSTRLDPNSGERLIAIGRDTLGHDGGSLFFDPSGLLYVTVGDGGPLRDPKGKAQDLSKLSGKILRIDVDHGAPFTIPPANPFVGVTGARGEIWAYGLRNPWRASFDRENADLWIADVGEDTREELDFVASGDPGGENFGWNRYEGTSCFDPSGNCDSSGLTPPILEYPHVEPGGAPPGGPCAIIGGFVYRGCAMPALRGAYFYGDFCAGFVKSVRYAEGAVSDQRDWTDAFRQAGLDSVSTFGEDADGELYVLDYLDGDVFRIVPVSG